MLNEGEGVLETETLSVVQPELLGDKDNVCEPVSDCVDETLSDGDSDALALPHDELLAERPPVSLAHAETDTEPVALCVSDTLGDDE